MNVINKDLLAKEFKEECVGECGCCYHYVQGKDDCDLITNAPVVEDIVYCNECKYASDLLFKTDAKTHGIDNKTISVCCKKDNRIHQVSWFCADGERR